MQIWIQKSFWTYWYPKHILKKPLKEAHRHTQRHDYHMITTEEQAVPSPGCYGKH